MKISDKNQRALHIYRTTGLKFGALKPMTENEVEAVAKALSL